MAFEQELRDHAAERVREHGAHLGLLIRGLKHLADGAAAARAANTELIHELDELRAHLARNFDEEQARQMLVQVEGRDYSPPRRQRILEWQAEQSFPIIPNADDPDSGNVYKTLRFPKELYSHIGHYQEEKAESHS